MEITKEIASKVLEVVDAGLVRGVGKPVPGQMCIEAAVCFALGEKHGDNPSCVSSAVRQLKIRLNDSNWSSDLARAKGLRRLGIAQLGTKDVIDDEKFARRCVGIAIRKAVPYALWCAAKIQKDPKHRRALLDAAHRCERDGTRVAAEAAAAAAKAAWAAAEAAAAAAEAAAAWAAAAAAAKGAAAAAAAKGAATAEAAERDRVLSLFAEEIVQLLIELKSPGTEYLHLTEPA